jgi:hypothetical protein
MTAAEATAAALAADPKTIDEVNAVTVLIGMLRGPGGIPVVGEYATALAALFTFAQEEGWERARAQPICGFTTLQDYCERVAEQPVTSKPRREILIRALESAVEEAAKRFPNPPGSGSLEL